MTLEDYVYWGGLLQGEGLTEYIRAFRRRMFDSSSAIFWMFNDCWPMVRSWTIVDHFLRRTPSFHPVRRAFLPLAVFLAVEDGKLRVFGVNEGPAWHGDLRCGLFGLSGGYPVDHRLGATLPANASTLLAELDAREWHEAGVYTHGAFAVLEDDGREVARDVLLLPLYKEMEWPRAHVSVEVSSGKATFSCETFAWRVCLDLDGELAFPDNFFDLLPGVPTTLDWSETLPAPRIVRLGNP
jgi:beta-mannosidase